VPEFGDIYFVCSTAREKPERIPQLARLMADQRVSLLDLGSSKIPPRHNIHFPTDGHIDEAGHKFVAEMLISWITQTLPHKAN
jgi:hypothetical protein